MSTGIDPVSRFQVFMSFRGSDVRKGFVSYLHRELSRKGIKSFLDDKEVEEEKDTGRQVSPSLLHAISDSKVAVVVLSQCYASSVWCLDELVKIMSHARKAVIPVFYEVDSSDVKHQRGRFGEEFKRHRQENPETLKRWREALSNLTNKPGFSSHDSEDDSKLVREITRHVSGLLTESPLQKELLQTKSIKEISLTAKKTSSGRRQVSDSDKLMAIVSDSSNSLVASDRLEKLMRKLLELHSTSETRVVGISGTQGIGKTTIARLIHRKLFSAFQSHCFLDTSGTQGIGKTSILRSLYQKSFQDHCLTETSKNIHNKGLFSRAYSSCSMEELPSPRGLKRKALQTSSDLGSDDKRTMFWNKRALVIVDNVETIKQLEEIMKDVSWLGPGSRVIITTQDKSLLLACGVEHVYEVDYLRYDEALELFSQCAFKKQYPPADFEQLSVRAVQLTGCLPLGLKLLGSFLSGKTKEDWESEVKSLEAKQDKAILELLKINVQGVPQGRTKEDREHEVQKHEKKKKIKPL